MGNSSNLWFALAVVLYSFVLLEQAVGKEIRLLTQRELLNNQEIQNKVSEWLQNDRAQLMRKKRADCCGHLGDDNQDVNKARVKIQDSPLHQDVKDPGNARRLSRHAGEPAVPLLQDTKQQKEVAASTVEVTTTTS
ncbi:unnamed protein product [Nezara viridula]|uniref:Neuropeptide n=1 Tax=Nezara viridula TaxID=85310 RepID=A0A9P0E550_NEZVI|nr:unnamed protein product [Nezara viridula]